jgi:hypothetical protein
VAAVAEPDPGGQHPGRRYLEGRLAAERAARAALAGARDRLRDVTRELDPLARAVVELDGSRGPERCFLVPRTAADDVGARAAQLVAGADDLRLSGPWPPYSFALDPAAVGS